MTENRIQSGVARAWNALPVADKRRIIRSGWSLRPRAKLEMHANQKFSELPINMKRWLSSIYEPARFL